MLSSNAGVGQIHLPTLLREFKFTRNHKLMFNASYKNLRGVDYKNHP